MDERMRAYIALEHALRDGDLVAARAALGAPPDWPNVSDPYTNTPLIALAIHWAPLEAITDLLRHGADPNVEVLDGFPSVLSAVLSDRPDTVELTTVLLEHGADPNTLGINGWSALHAAAGRDDVGLIRLLVGHGADTDLRTNVDDYETPYELAQRCDRHAAAALLEELAR
jgi:ankyrin repeat protein